MKSKKDNKINMRRSSQTKNEAFDSKTQNSNVPTITGLLDSISSSKRNNELSINIKVLQILFLFCFASFLSNTNCKTNKKHFCGTDLLKTPKRILVPEAPLPFSSSASAKRYGSGEPQKWEPMRIHFDFSYIEQKVSEGIIKQKDLNDLKDKIMPKAKEVFEGLLRVKRIRNQLKLNSPHCETFPIPDAYNHGGKGVTADIVIFVLIDTSGFFSDNGIEAAAIHCLQHQETRRPIAGYIQFKSDLSVNSQNAKDYYAWLAIHEISHILVINRALFEDYIDPESLVPLGYDRVIGSKILESGSKMNFIKTPKVLEKAKNHFGCAKLYGLPLEYNGGSGTAGSHWAKRYMNGDYMIGESFGENLISEMSLALFEDSGWYKVNWEMANLFVWGKSKGCEFFDRDKKCVYADKAEIDFGRLYSTLVEFASAGMHREKNESDAAEAVNSSRIMMISENSKENEEFISVTNNIFQNSFTKERLSLKVLKKKATEKKLHSSRIKKKINSSRNRNGTNIDNSNDTNTNSTTAYSNSNNYNKDYVHNLISKVFENYTSFEDSTSAKKYILQYKTNFIDEFCTDFNMPVCSTSHIFRGYCTVQDPVDPIDKHEMHFKNTRISGIEKLTDRCPTAIETRYAEALYGGSCRYGEKFPNSKSFEKICPECACFMSNLRETEKKNQMKKNFRVTGINNDNNKNTKRTNTDIQNDYFKNANTNKGLLISNNISQSENFLRENKNDAAQYEKIITYTKKRNNELFTYSFIEKTYSEKFSTNNNGGDKDKDNNYKNKENSIDEDSEQEEYNDEYEIIKLNPTLKPEDFIASCFEFKCEKGNLYVFMNDKKFKCEEKGEITKIPGYEGGIRCPSKTILCDEKYLCKFGCTEKFNNTNALENFDQ